MPSRSARVVLVAAIALASFACGELRKTRAAAEAGDAAAQNQLGQAYFFGRDVKQDDATAAIWFRKAAEQGNADAQLSLGWLYEQGRGVEKSEAEAVEWYRKAAEQGNARGQTYLGTAYLRGQGVEPSDSKAIEWYEKAVAQNEPMAQNGLAYYLATRPGVSDPELERALALARAAHSALPSDIATTDTLGWVLVKLNRAREGIPHLVAASRGKPPNPEVFCHLGFAYRDVGRNDDATVALRRALKSESFEGRAECKALLSELLALPKKTAQRVTPSLVQSSFASAPQNSSVVARPPWSGVSARPSA